jgi:hypothetical protein
MGHEEVAAAERERAEGEERDGGAEEAERMGAVRSETGTVDLFTRKPQSYP